MSPSVRIPGAPGEIRTPDLLIRSQTLYPTELRAQKGVNVKGASIKCPITKRNDYAAYR